MTVDEIIFLTFEQVADIHKEQLEQFGGQDGFIDRGVIESAVAQPKATMFGEYLHDDIAHMAAAYLFHLAAAQGFLDGNKRTGANAAITFLAMNGYDLNAQDMDIYDVTMEVANGRLDREGVAVWFRERMIPMDDE